MPAEYLYPGVYIEEIEQRPSPIEGSPTSRTALLGSCRRGPANTPVAVRSMAAFDRAFPEAAKSPLRRAARQFFANSGRPAHLVAVRVTEPSTALANLVEQDPQLIVVQAGLVDLAEAHDYCQTQRALLVCDAHADGTLPDGLGPNAAAYFPALAGGRGTLPCAPAVAGVIARLDATRGVWKAPAGAEATVAGALSREVSSRDVDDLARKHVNALRTLPSGVTVVWGARTASSDPEWKYVSVRRMILFLERSIERWLACVAFEVNDESLWVAVRSAIAAFLDGLWRQGALVGAKSSEGFFVRCDRTTMTQADIDAGRLVVLVGVALIRPAEFVVIHIDARTAGSS